MVAVVLEFAISFIVATADQLKRALRKHIGGTLHNLIGPSTLMVILAASILPSWSKHRCQNVLVAKELVQWMGVIPA